MREDTQKGWPKRKEHVKAPLLQPGSPVGRIFLGFSSGEFSEVGHFSRAPWH
jgi:hypothetical protein